MLPPAGSCAAGTEVCVMPLPCPAVDGPTRRRSPPADPLLPGFAVTVHLMGWGTRDAPTGRPGTRRPPGQYAEPAVDLVGNTPLVRLNSVTRDLGPDAPLVLAKLEYLNPGGSVKDRIAVRMVDAAEASGALQPGGTIVEPTSGNTGIGLALVAQQRGYKCIFVCPDKVGQEKINVLRAYGAEVVVCPTAVDPSDPRSYYSVSDRLARETPGGWKPDQYSNPA